MKLCRFHLRGPDDAMPRSGILRDDHVEEVTGTWPGKGNPTGGRWPIERVRLLAPVVPSKIVCVGRNYREHAAELGNPVPQEPLIFLKAPSSIIGPGDTILTPSDSARVDYEGELAVVIGCTCSQLASGESIEPYLAGFTCLNDVTARDLQKRDVQFGRAKSFDTFCPLGPVIETEFDWKQARVETWVNGELKQSGATSEMIFPVDELLRWVSRIMTLLPGDVIATGTPEGVSPLHSGDVVAVLIEGIGRLSNPVAPRRKR